LISYFTHIKQAPGGRDHAKFVPRALFEDLSLPHSDGNYFLRPDQILTVFIMKMDKVPSRTEWYANDMDLEKELEEMQEKDLHVTEASHKSNLEQVEKGVKLLIPIKKMDQHNQNSDQGHKDEDGVEHDGMDDEESSRLSSFSFFTNNNDKPPVATSAPPCGSVVNPFLQYLNSGGDDDDDGGGGGGGGGDIEVDKKKSDHQLPTSSSSFIFSKSIAGWEKTKELLGSNNRRSSSKQPSSPPNPLAATISSSSSSSSSNSVIVINRDSEDVFALNDMHGGNNL
jgi:hypothetical protein